MNQVKQEPEEDAGARLAAAQHAGGHGDNGYDEAWDGEVVENGYEDGASGGGGYEDGAGGGGDCEDGPGGGYEDGAGGGEDYERVEEDSEEVDLDELIVEDEEEALAMEREQEDQEEDEGQEGEADAAGPESGEAAGRYRQAGGSESDGEGRNGGGDGGDGGARQRRPPRRGGMAERRQLVHHCFYCGAQGSLNELVGCGACNVLTFSPCCCKRAHISCAAKLPGVLLPGFEALGLWFCGKARKGYPPHTAALHLDVVHGPSDTARQLRAYLAGRAALQAQVAVAPDGEFFQPGRRIAKLARGLVPAPPGTGGGRQYVFEGMLPAAARPAAAAAGAATGATGAAAAALSPMKRAQSGVGSDGGGSAGGPQAGAGGSAASPAKRPRRRAAAAAAAGIQADVRADMQPEARRADPHEVLPARPSPGGAAAADARPQRRPVLAAATPPPHLQQLPLQQQPTGHQQARQAEYAAATCPGASAAIAAELHVRPGAAAGSGAHSPQAWLPLERRAAAEPDTAGAAAAAAAAAAEVAALRAQLEATQRELAEERTGRIRAEARAEFLEEQRRRHEQELREERDKAVEARVTERMLRRQLAELENQAQG
ncbi:hypothetical protein HXX76_005940 [Chlamydomonas incerta]|uniref:Uncharacterized protein n=1 Tax=Chlamydomonas incerta TaxID=51695 RepID=A0A835T4L2_CHLIN|nr:hypothetical protein HXX76_005940 [Chlamydomonas incerta]|eukprot:KAG2437281.1 hypothetical protein HXX76_005940 [Chlamydomonas incerta]